MQNENWPLKYILHAFMCDVILIDSLQINYYFAKMFIT